MTSTGRRSGGSEGVGAEPPGPLIVGELSGLFHLLVPCLGDDCMGGLEESTVGEPPASPDKMISVKVAADV